MKLNLSIGVLVAAQLAAGFALQMLVLSLVGAGVDSDAFIAAQAVPLVLFSVLSACLQNVWQPKLAVAAAGAEAWNLTQNMAQGQAMVLFGVASALLIASAPAWAGILFPGVQGAHQDLVVTMTRVLLAAALLNGHSALLTTALRSKDVFLPGEAIVLVGSLLALVGAWIFVPRWGVEAAAWLALGRAALTCAAMNVLAGWPRPAPLRAIRQRDSWLQLAPLLASSSLYKSGPLVDRYWSSHAPPGGMTAFGLAQSAVGALTMLIERAVCMPVGPRLARFAEAGDFEKLRSAYRRCVFLVTVASIPVVLLLVGMLPIWSDLVGWAFKMDSALATQTWWICLCLVGYLHVGASGTIIVAGFYALHDTRTPSVVLAIAFVAGVFVKSLGFMAIGLEGLAIGTSLYHLLNLFALTALLERTLSNRMTTK